MITATDDLPLVADLTMSGWIACLRRRAGCVGGLDELLKETLFTSLAQARVALGCWRADYNDTRPHSQLGWKTPSEFAMTCHSRRDLALRYSKGSAPAPVTSHRPTGQIHR